MVLHKILHKILSFILFDISLDDGMILKNQLSIFKCIINSVIISFIKWNL